MAHVCPAHVQVVIAPSSIHLDYVKANIRPDIGEDTHGLAKLPASEALVSSILGVAAFLHTAVSAQNVALSPKYGAFTGETPAPMLKDFGVGWTLTGESLSSTLGLADMR